MHKLCNPECNMMNYMYNYLLYSDDVQKYEIRKLYGIEEVIGNTRKSCEQN